MAFHIPRFFNIHARAIRAEDLLSSVKCVKSCTPRRCGSRSCGRCRGLVHLKLVHLPKAVVERVQLRAATAGTADVAAPREDPAARAKGPEREQLERLARLRGEDLQARALGDEEAAAAVVETRPETDGLPDSPAIGSTR